MRTAASPALRFHLVWGKKKKGGEREENEAQKKGINIHDVCLRVDCSSFVRVCMFL